MKRTILSILFFVGYCSIVSAQYSVVSPSPTRTPKNSVLEVLQSTTTDWTTIEKNDRKNAIALAYPGTTFLADATKTYNCHNYAWHMTDGGAYTYWMNQINQSLAANISKYWTDGSYVEVCSDAAASRIFYYAGDHSAVKSTVSGMYESKWGPNIRIRHSPTNVPPEYIGSSRRYFASTKISGSTATLCSGSRNFTVANISGASYTWVVSGTLSIVSGQGTSSVNVQRNGSSSGEGWIEVQVSTSCSSGASTSKRESFHVGTPTVSAISVDASMCNGYGQNVTATILGSPSFSQWNVTSGNAANAYLTDYGSGTCYFNSYINDCYGLQIQMTNVCGSSIDGTTICVDNCLARYNVYPNPAKDHISIAFDHFASAGSMPDQITLFAENTQNAVYSTKKTEIFNSAGKNGVFEIDVHSLPRGVYYLHIISGQEGEKKTEKIRVLLE